MLERVRTIASAVGATGVLGLVDSGATLFRTTDPTLQNFTGTLYVATPALLRYYGISAADVEPGTDILTSRRGLRSADDLVLRAQPGPAPSPEAAGGASAGCPPSSCIAHPAIQVTDRLPAGTSAPNTVITEQALARLGLRVGEPEAWMVDSSHSITDAEKYTAQALAAAAGMTVATKSSQPSLQSLESWSAAAGIALALGVLAMTAGLIRSEAGRDLRTLTAAGASSRVRRVITATTTGGLGLLGGVIGAAVGLAGVVAFYRHHLDQVFFRLPVDDLLILAVGLPLGAFVGGWLLSGREPAAIARRPLE
jgi:putative ABC transport system permease protein